MLPDFSGRRGYAPCFSTGDLLAAGILKRLTEECGVRIGFLKSISEEIVRLCNASSWAALENAFLHIDLPSGQCRIVKSGAVPTGSSAAILCELDPILIQLRDTLLRTQPGDNQFPLRFPLASVKPRARSGRRRA
ncbi:hypothetical protein [Pseudorhodoplanes sp.]|uniref:hypothetical protein n=1 Tax=Pseudorhodoplanes sp. TaxID=1934341 RepID=UPI003D0EBFA7